MSEQTNLIKLWFFSMTVMCIVLFLHKAQLICSSMLKISEIIWFAFIAFILALKIQIRSLFTKWLFIIRKTKLCFGKNLILRILANFDKRTFKVVQKLVNSYTFLKTPGQFQTNILIRRKIKVLHWGLWKSCKNPRL